MNSVERRIYEIGIVPVVSLKDATLAQPLAEALEDGGVPVVEVTFRTEAAEEAICQIASEVPSVLVGAGTVLTIEQAKRAIDAGAKFVVSPGYNDDVVNYCLDRGLPIIPGCQTPSDIEHALARGLTTVKFFPAEASGGLPMIKALCGPYPNMRFIPTGGIDQNNLLQYLSFPKVAACGGSWIIKQDALTAGNVIAIREAAQNAVLQMLGMRLCHIGIHNENAATALANAHNIMGLFGWPVREGAGSIFAGSAIEFMKAPFLGEKGHIAIGVNCVDRARAYLQGRGVAFREETAKYAADGTCETIYLAQEIQGFALHLINNE